VARRRIGFWRRFAVMVLKPPLWLLTRRDWRDADRIPRTGGVIIVVNHVSHFDPLVVAHFIYDAGRWPQFLAKQSVFDLPVIGWLLRQVRQIPVRRGTIDAAQALDAAVAAVRAGDAVVIYPEGTTTKHPDLWLMRGKTGAARLWLATGAPVIPVVSWGPQAVYDPRTSRLRLRPRTPVTVVAGPPVDLSGFEGAEATSANLQAVTGVMMSRLTGVLADIRQESPPDALPLPADGAR
jgi:1-acyl-sn-glycerol-3-phosphate acyltransferase